MADDKAKAFQRKVWLRIFQVIGLLTFAMLYGTIGFHILEGASLFDSFYMAVITMTTVGYDEHIPLSTAGRLFGVTTIFVGLIGSGLSVGVLTHLLFEETLLDALKGKRMSKRLSVLKDHFIVCGHGTTGKSIVHELLAQNEEVVIIDLDPDDETIGKNGYFLKGDAREDEVLELARIAHAKGLASTLTEDADNVFVTLTARALNPDLRIVSRFKDEDTEKKLIIAGADEAVSPYHMGGQRISLSLTIPEFQKLLDATFRDNTLGVHFSQIPVPPDSPIRGKTIRDCEFRKHSMGAMVVAVIEENGNSIFNPEETLPLETIKEILVLGDNGQLKELRAYVGTTPESPTPESQG